MKNITIKDFEIVSIPDFIREGEIIKVMGKRMFNKFAKFMTGQTCMIYEGELVYYPCDVENFLHKGNLFFD